MPRAVARALALLAAAGASPAAPPRGPASEAACARGAACEAGAAAGEEAALLQVRAASAALAVAPNAPSVLCPFSDTYCAGDQCCPSAPGSGGLTYPCPSSDPSFAGCENNTRASLPAPAPTPAPQSSVGGLSPLSGDYSDKVVLPEYCSNNGCRLGKAALYCRKHYPSLVGSTVYTTVEYNAHTSIGSATSTVLGTAVKLHPAGIASSHYFLSSRIPRALKAQGVWQVWFEVDFHNDTQITVDANAANMSGVPSTCVFSSLPSLTDRFSISGTYDDTLLIPYFRTNSGEPMPSKSVQCGHTYPDFIGTQVTTKVTWNRTANTGAATASLFGARVRLHPAGIAGLNVFVSSRIPSALSDLGIWQVTFEVARRSDLRLDTKTTIAANPLNKLQGLQGDSCLFLSSLRIG